MATASYWALACRVCDEMIALALIEFDGNKQLIKPDPVGAFEVDCGKCGNTRLYAPYEVMPWEGPLPGPVFKTHPALQQPPLQSRPRLSLTRTSDVLRS